MCFHVLTVSLVMFRCSLLVGKVLLLGGPRRGLRRTDTVAAAISRRTVAVYASAPSFTHGVVDPVAELAAANGQTVEGRV